MNNNYFHHSMKTPSSKARENIPHVIFDWHPPLFGCSGCMRQVVLLLIR